MKRLREHTIVITGASSGIGPAKARAAGAGLLVLAWLRRGVRARRG